MSPSKEKLAVAAHVLPFVAWLLLMLLPGDAAGWLYALRTLVGLLFLFALRPWRWYTAPRVGQVLLPALGAGTAVFVVWVLPETEWFGRLLPAVRDFYMRYAVDLRHFGRLPQEVLSPRYGPDVCGWPLTLIRLAGSGLVIAVIEEFFFRGFLYRFLLDEDFTEVDLGRFEWTRFLIVVVLFGLEHDRWLAGLVAGAVYGALTIHGRNIWSAVVAHSVTNILLGIHVIYNGAYQFWA